jgi:hypothetical protein
MHQAASTITGSAGEAWRAGASATAMSRKMCGIAPARDTHNMLAIVLVVKAL